jgi:hypothetical protein
MYFLLVLISRVIRIIAKDFFGSRKISFKNIWAWVIILLIKFWKPSLKIQFVWWNFNLLQTVYVALTTVQRRLKIKIPDLLATFLRLAPFCVSTYKTLKKTKLFSLNLILRTVTEFCRHISIFVKIDSKNRCTIWYTLVTPRV